MNLKHYFSHKQQHMYKSSGDEEVSSTFMNNNNASHAISPSEEGSTSVITKTRRGYKDGGTCTELACVLSIHDSKVPEMSKARVLKIYPGTWPSFEKCTMDIKNFLEIFVTKFVSRRF